MMSRNGRRWRRSTILVLALGLAGCAGLFTTAPRPLFRLTAPSEFPANLPHVSAQFVIDVPYAAASLDTSRIAMARSPVSLDYLADGDWTDRAPMLVQAALIEAFENSRAVGAVGAQSLSLHADFVLEGDLRHFEAVYDSHPGGGDTPPAVWVALEVKLVKIPEHTIVGQTLFTARETAATNATPLIVVAFNTAMANVAQQVVSWAVGNRALSAPRR
jgi:cholesterol transport system auxiliary component